MSAVIDENKPEMEQYAEKLLEMVKAQFEDQELNMGNIFIFLRLAMEHADKFKELEGRNKKELVIRIMHEALEDFVLEGDDKEALRIFVDKMVDLVIDNFCDINLGNLHINEDQKKVLRRLFPCMFSA